MLHKQLVMGVNGWHLLGNPDVFMGLGARSHLRQGFLLAAMALWFLLSEGHPRRRKV